MTNCKQCGADVEVKEGRRPREFCDNKGKCRNLFHRKSVKEKIEGSEAARLREEFDKYKSDAEERLLRLTMSLSNTSNTAGNKKEDAGEGKQGNGGNEAENSSEVRHRLWKEGDPVEGTFKFILKYGVQAYDEIEKGK